MPVTKTSCLLLLLCTVIFVSAQEQTPTFGNPTQDELDLMEYKLDPEATAIVLYEGGDYHFAMVNNSMYMIKNVHRKIKVLKPKQFNGATVKLYTYRPSKDNYEYFSTLDAITHNGPLKQYVALENYYRSWVNGGRLETAFTFPKVEKGSVLEYQYTIVSPFFFNLGTWSFQNEYPTLVSEIKTRIPGNLTYNRVLVGDVKLDMEETFIEKNCFFISRNYPAADCETAHYKMTNIPAFTSEEYMLSPRNYIIAVDYELRNFFGLNGGSSYYSKTWEDVEDALKKSKNIGRQLKKNNFLKNQVPERLLKIASPLERAEAIYIYIRDYFTWDGSTTMYENINVREAFKAKKGNVSEINLSLINALQAANLDAKIILSTTRDNKIPTDRYPVLTDFNYIMAYVTINGKEYLLDASDRNLTFGMLPNRALNVRGRVMDFDNGSFWLLIEPYDRNIHFTQCSLTLTEEGTIIGNSKETISGLLAYEMRKNFDVNLDTQIEHNIEETTVGLEVDNFLVEKKLDVESPLTLAYNLELQTESNISDIYFNPFFLQRHFRTNPFKNESRQFPIDFGYPIRLIYLVTLDIPSSYAFKNIPESQTIKLQEAGEIAVAYQSTDTKLSVRLTFNLNDYRYHTEAYGYVRDFFENLASLQDSSIISIEKLD